MNNKDVQYLNDLSYGYWKSQALFVASELDLFTLIGVRGKSGKVIAKKLGTHLRATEMLLNALVSLKLLTKSRDIFNNTAVSRRCLMKDSPAYQGDRIQHFHNMWDYWSKLSTAVKTGKPTAYDNAKRGVDKQRLREFIKAMHNNASVQADELYIKLQIKKYSRLLDLAGGQGTYAVKFAEKNRNLKAVVFDLPDVIKITREHIKESGMTGQITAKAGNCLEDSLGKELYDIVLVSHLLHAYDASENQKILKKCWDSLMKDGIVVIQEFILNPSKTMPLFGTLFSLNMLMGTHNGSSFSAIEIKEWLKRAGFKGLKRIDLGMDSGLIIGCKL
ncbi:MAG: methyltransferase domain-containing protein [Candidatus Scalindua rubra]|uniref:Methyltransferase n=1 Tax=Candidatus Scalindua brodae TaxID=237368 RepID=A0A0B0ELJ0_9BACT|nr:MAG: methyltransferase [Candidatus Scalindua brodae]MBZ0108066.1 methyltransferase domain-containing protein [Candidatus Scalindua rubra]TWU38028.1 Demethylspheroidene O-methyltransferase [Candidatus Brocadiaceae bacterium S225]